MKLLFWFTVTWLVLSEIFPKEVRGRAYSFINCFNVGANLIVTFSFLSITGMHNHHGHTQTQSSLYEMYLQIIFILFQWHFSFFSDVIGLSGIFFVYGVIGMAAVVFIYLVLPETKGKSLHKIDRELSQTR